MPADDFEHEQQLLAGLPVRQPASDSELAIFELWTTIPENLNLSACIHTHTHFFLYAINKSAMLSDVRGVLTTVSH